MDIFYAALMHCFNSDFHHRHSEIVSLGSLQFFCLWHSVFQTCSTNSRRVPHFVETYIRRGRFNEIFNTDNFAFIFTLTPGEPKDIVQRNILFIAFAELKAPYLKSRSSTFNSQLCRFKFRINLFHLLIHYSDSYSSLSIFFRDGVDNAARPTQPSFIPDRKRYSIRRKCQRKFFLDRFPLMCTRNEQEERRTVTFERRPVEDGSHVVRHPLLVNLISSN